MEATRIYWLKRCERGVYTPFYVVDDMTWREKRRIKRQAKRRSHWRSKADKTLDMKIAKHAFGLE